jgi:SpoVK/Ycf46/Vps4 family AAA+-type ATPase
VTRLPPELLRKGRFDEMFFVDLPDVSTRAEIFGIHLARRELNVEQFDLAALAVACGGFSGAELEQVVVSAVYAGQARSSEPNQDMLLDCIRATAPLSVVMAEKLDELRGWASGRTVLA